MSAYHPLSPPKTQSTTNTKPSSEHKMARWRWVLMALALSFVVLPGMHALGSLFVEAQAAQEISPTVTLPTVPPVQVHQLTPAEYAGDIISQMSLDDEIAQMIMIKLIGTNYSSTEAVMVQREHVGAVLAFGDAIANPSQVRQLTASLAQHAYLPLWIATDQEGGYVNRFQPLVGYRPGEEVIGATGNLAAATAAGQQTAKDFASFGFNFDLAPVVDINQPGVTTGQLYGRMYSTDPNAIAPMANAYLEGLQQSGKIVGTLKHFPGLGAASTDPHRGLPIIYKTQAQLDAHEFVPYRQLLTMGNVQAIMVTHEYLPEIDPAYPATLSHKITTGLLRDDLGFQGVIVTDSLDMEALAEQYPIDQAGLLAAEAGADVLMGPSTPDAVQAIIDDISSAVQSGKIAKSRIDDSVRRILTLKIAMGLIHMPASDVTATPSPTLPVITPTKTPHKR